MKSKIFMQIIFVLICIFCESLSAKDAPQVIHYQGNLADHTGNSVNAVLPMIFRIFDANTGGKILWTEIHPDVEVKVGLFNVILGDTNNGGAAFPLQLFLTKKFLEIQIADEVLSPRQVIAGESFTPATFSDLNFNPSLPDSLTDNFDCATDFNRSWFDEQARINIEGTFAPTGNPPIQWQPAKNLGKSPNELIYVIGGTDTYWNYFIEIPFPDCLKDINGGTIRFIMQHETDRNDQVRILDMIIGTEYDNDNFGNRGRSRGRYGWTRELNGDNHSWILGDNNAQNIAQAWDWAWMVDYRWGQGNSELPGEFIRIYSNPYVTTRLIIKD